MPFNVSMIPGYHKIRRISRLILCIFVILSLFAFKYKNGDHQFSGFIIFSILLGFSCKFIESSKNLTKISYKNLVWRNFAL